MIALTQKQREELIHECKSDIAALKLRLKREFARNHPPHRGYPEKSIMIHEIALSALMAEPASPASFVAYFPDSEKYEGRAHSESNEECARRIAKGIGGYVRAMFIEEDGVSLFTAPPVPEIKLPSKPQDAFEEGNKIPPNTQRCGDSYCVSTFHNWKGEKFMHQFEGFLKGINYVKRLNGLGE